MTDTALKPPALSIQSAGPNVVLTDTAQATTTCTVEYKQSPDDPGWTWLQTFTGTGGPVTISDSNTTGSARFYRSWVQ